MAFRGCFGFVMFFGGDIGLMLFSSLFRVVVLFGFGDLGRERV